MKTYHFEIYWDKPGAAFYTNIATGEVPASDTQGAINAVLDRYAAFEVDFIQLFELDEYDTPEDWNDGEPIEYLG